MYLERLVDPADLQHLVDLEDQLNLVDPADQLLMHLADQKDLEDQQQLN